MRVSVQDPKLCLGPYVRPGRRVWESHRLLHCWDHLAPESCWEGVLGEAEEGGEAETKGGKWRRGGKGGGREGGSEVVKCAILLF